MNHIIKLYEKYFPVPTPLQVAQQQLADAEMQVLKHTLACEYHKHQTEFHQCATNRLQRYIQKQTNEHSL